VSEADVRPWGDFVVLSDADDHKVKRLTVLPGKRLSYQRHSRRTEHWFVVRGHGSVTLDATPHPVGPGSAVDVPVGTAHRIENTGDEPLVFVEVQTGDYFGEDDIERIEDDFGRT
jgi:mannose-6-phosphate isomerase